MVCIGERPLTPEKSLSGFFQVPVGPNGNLTSDGTWTYTWNDENRLASATKTADTKLEFLYDGFGRRRIKKVYSWDTDHWSLTSELRFSYDGLYIIAEMDSSGNLVRNYVRNGSEILSATDTAGTFIYYTDGNKNVTDIANSSGAVVAHYEYSPFGGITAQTGTYAGTNPFRFSSEYFDSETGLVAYLFRYYSPEFARWLSRDPIEENGGVNLYGMVGNNPVGRRDYMGLDMHYVDDGNGLGHWEGDTWWEQAQANTFYNGSEGFWYAADTLIGQPLRGLSEGISDLEYRLGMSIEEFQQNLNQVPVNPATMLPLGLEKAIAAGLIFIRVDGKWIKLTAQELAKLGKEEKAALICEKAAEVGKNAKNLVSLRKKYEDEVQALKSLAQNAMSAGQSLEDTARMLNAERNALKIKYRGLTPPDIVKVFEQRNIEKYGNPLGPTIEQLRTQGKTWEEIIESATRFGGQDLGF